VSALGKRSLVLLLACFALQFSALAHPQTGKRASQSTLEKKLAAYLKPYLEMNDLSGTFLFAKNGRVLLEKSYGYANLELGVRNRRETRFRIGSISKEFTAAAILILQQEGRLDVHSTVQQFLPTLPNAKQITITELLTHTAGLARDLPNKREFSKSYHSLDELVMVAEGLPAAAEPGKRFQYSNLDYLLLAYIVEQSSGRDYGEFLAEKIFLPLKMTHTSVDKHSEITRDRASGYQTGLGDSLVNAPFEDMSNETGYGSLVSTAEDLLKWEEAWNNDNVLTKENWKAMFSDYGHQYGYGVSIHQLFHRTVIGHDGEVAGFNTALHSIPEEKLCVIYLANIESGVLTVIQDDLIALALNESYKIPARRPLSVTVAPEILKSYVGTYEVFPGLVLETSLENGTLSLNGNGSEFVALTPLSPTRFYYRHLYAEITFQKDASDQVTGLVWKTSSGEYPAKKTH
jgi:CubicO group peptidase (beta-lactamase class C family)